MMTQDQKNACITIFAAMVKLESRKLDDSHNAPQIMFGTKLDQTKALAALRKLDEIGYIKTIYPYASGTYYQTTEKGRLQFNKRA